MRMRRVAFLMIASVIIGLIWFLLSHQPKGNLIVEIRKGDLKSVKETIEFSPEQVNRRNDAGGEVDFANLRRTDIAEVECLSRCIDGHSGGRDQ